MSSSTFTNLTSLGSWLLEHSGQAGILNRELFLTTVFLDE